MNVRTFVTTTAVIAVGLVWGCATTTEQYLGAEDAGPAPSFVTDAASDVPDSTFTLTSYCPSSECPAGHTTCPDSRFLCDIDLKSDPNNCGSCGFACAKDAFGAMFACVDGTCEMQCGTAPVTLNCDGIVDNGCEVSPDTNENCGACGVKCTDPANPCVMTGTGNYGCGCGGSDILCDFCLDPRKDDSNCGACGVVCDPENAGDVTYPNMYYGCRDSNCGRLKCLPGFSDCNARIDDGCETSTTTTQNCGACGVTCNPGQECGRTVTGEYMCMCDPGKTLCSLFGIIDFCVDTATDPFNCGGCGAACAGTDTAKFVFPVCRYGSCETACQQGHADCNGNLADGCEVNTDFDPRNCGGCGITCDAVAGQACAAGRCVVTPCDVDAGGAR